MCAKWVLNTISVIKTTLWKSVGYILWLYICLTDGNYYATCSVHQTVFGKMEEYRVVIVYVSEVRILEDFILHSSFPESCVLEWFACPCFKTLPLGISKLRCGCSYRLASCLVSQLQLLENFRQRSVRSELCDCYRQNQTVNRSGMFDYWRQTHH